MDAIKKLPKTYMQSDSEKKLFKIALSTGLAVLSFDTWNKTIEFRIKALERFLKARQNSSDYIGGGLPLLYPKFDIGFTYSEYLKENNFHNYHFENDIRIGGRLPHCWLQISFGNQSRIISSVYLHSLVPSSSPFFQLIIIKDELLYWNNILSKYVGRIPIQIVCIASSDENTHSHRSLQNLLRIPFLQSMKLTKENDLLMYNSSSLKENKYLSETSSTIFLSETTKEFEYSLFYRLNSLKYAVLLRPDGHIGALLSRFGKDGECKSTSIDFGKLMNELFFTL